MGVSLGQCQFQGVEDCKEWPYLFSDHSITEPSPPPLAKLTESALCDKVACGCHARPPTRSLCPIWDEGEIELQYLVYLPRKVLIGVHAGTFHNLRLPDQLPVASDWPSGAKRTIDTGRVSPICEPRLENVYSMSVMFLEG